MAYLFYIDGVLLPVTPSSIEISTGSRNETVNLINGGEINLIRSPSLKEISFEMSLPRFYYPSINYTEETIKPIKYYIDFLEGLKNDKKSFQFIISRSRPDSEQLESTNICCALEDIKKVEEAANGLDVIYEISLREWKSYGTKIVNVNSDGTTATQIYVRQMALTTQNIKYTVKENDTLASISIKYYGDDTHVDEIAQANGIDNPNLIYPGAVLTLNDVTYKTELPELNADAYGEGWKGSYDASNKTLTFSKIDDDATEDFSPEAYGVDFNIYPNGDIVYYMDDYVQYDGNKNIKNIDVSLDGKACSFSGYMQDDENWIKARSFMENLGYEVDWNDGTNMITATKDGESTILDIRTSLGSDGSTYTPIRDLCSQLGYDVNWSQSNGIVVTERG